MPESITPLLRVLAPMPSFGICSTTKTSLHRRDTARATAQPTTPPPIITMFARSTWNSIADYKPKTSGRDVPRLDIFSRGDRVALYNQTLARLKAGATKVKTGLPHRLCQPVPSGRKYCVPLTERLGLRPVAKVG